MCTICIVAQLKQKRVRIKDNDDDEVIASPLADMKIRRRGAMWEHQNHLSLPGYMVNWVRPCFWYLSEHSESMIDC